MRNFFCKVVDIETNLLLIDIEFVKYHSRGNDVDYINEEDIL